MTSQVLGTVLFLEQNLFCIFWGNCNWFRWLLGYKKRYIPYLYAESYRKNLHFYFDMYIFSIYWGTLFFVYDVTCSTIKNVNIRQFGLDLSYIPNDKISKMVFFSSDLEYPMCLNRFNNGYFFSKSNSEYAPKTTRRIVTRHTLINHLLIYDVNGNLKGKSHMCNNF